MTFQHHSNSPTVNRQLNDQRPYWLRVNHWLYAITKRKFAPASYADRTSELDRIEAYRKKLQSKSSLLVSTKLTASNKLGKY